MSPEPRDRLTLEFDLAADPVAGVVRDGAGSSEAFVGWIALTRAIEIALDAARGVPSSRGDARAPAPSTEPSRSKS